MLATSNKLRPVTIGNLTLVDELQHGFRPAFAEARRDAEIRRFLIAPYLWRERTADEAERFGRRLIELTSARLPELQSKPSDVGPVAECHAGCSRAGLKTRSHIGRQGRAALSGLAAASGPAGARPRCVSGPRKRIRSPLVPARFHTLS